VDATTRDSAAPTELESWTKSLLEAIELVNTHGHQQAVHIYM
jgi:hypothetical protein